MAITRREFLGSAAAAVSALALPIGVASAGRPTRACVATSRCALVDLGDGCAMRESLAGYESALTSSGADWTRADATSLSSGDLLIVPAALGISSSLARLILRSVRSGATVILESGAVFAAADDRDFHAHRDALRDLLDIRVGPPVALWPRSPSSRGVPYVEYTWPSQAMVRDFSRVLPLAHDPHGGDIIARVDGLPAALRRRTGPGTLLFLGSPLGTALWAGDAEARRWLGQLSGAS